MLTSAKKNQALEETPSRNRTLLNSIAVSEKKSTNKQATSHEGAAYTLRERVSTSELGHQHQLNSTPLSYKYTSTNGAADDDAEENGEQQLGNVEELFVRMDRNGQIPTEPVEQFRLVDAVEPRKEEQVLPGGKPERRSRISRAERSRSRS